MHWTSAKIQEDIFLYWKSHKILFIINRVILQYISHRNIYFPVVIIALFQLLKPFKLVVTQRWQWDLTFYNVLLRIVVTMDTWPWKGIICSSIDKHKIVGLSKQADLMLLLSLGKFSKIDLLSFHFGKLSGIPTSQVAADKKENIAQYILIWGYFVYDIIYCLSQ